MALVVLHPDYPQEQFRRDSEELPPGGCRIVEAWPGSVRTHVHVWPDGRRQLFIDGVALRIFGVLPREAICVWLELVPPEHVAEYRAKGLPPLSYLEEQAGAEGAER